MLLLLAVGRVLFLPWYTVPYYFNKHFRSPKIRFRCLLDYLHYLSFGEILATSPFFKNCIKVFEVFFYFLSIRRNSIHVFTTYTQLIAVTQVTHSHLDC